jgi:hypothetical protein
MAPDSLGLPLEKARRASISIANDFADILFLQGIHGRAVHGLFQGYHGFMPG